MRGDQRSNAVGIFGIRCDKERGVVSEGLRVLLAIEELQVVDIDVLEVRRTLLFGEFLEVDIDAAAYGRPITATRGFVEALPDTGDTTTPRDRRTLTVKTTDLDLESEGDLRIARRPYLSPPVDLGEF